MIKLLFSMSLPHPSVLSHVCCPWSMLTLLLSYFCIKSTRGAYTSSLESQHKNGTLKEYVSSISLGVGFKMWGKVMKELDEKYQSVVMHSAKEVIAMTSTIGSTIASKIPVGLNWDNLQQRRYHQSSMCAFYASIIRSFNGTQSDFMHLISTMVLQNTKLFIDMDLLLWNHWFHRYFTVNQPAQSVWLRPILLKMQEKGSRCKPDEDTFGVIIDTILDNKAIKDPERMIQQISNEFKVFKLQIPLQCQFRLLRKTGDRIQLLRFLRFHDEVRFHGADVQMFNDLLSNFVNDYPIKRFTQEGSLEEKITFIINRALPFHGLNLNEDTYRILRKFYVDFPEYSRTLNALRCW